MIGEAKRCSVEQYLQEGLLALVPVYGDSGDTSAVLTLAGWHKESRVVSWLVGRIAVSYSLDLITLRRRCGRLLNLKRHMALAINENLVLLPAQVRQARMPGEATIGYLCMLQVKEVLPLPAEKDSPWLSKVIFKNGHELKTLNTAERLQQRLRQGEMVRADHLKRQGQGLCFSGLKREALAEQLPNCDCLLRELFMERFGLDPKRPD